MMTSITFLFLLFVASFGCMIVGFINIIYFSILNYQNKIKYENCTSFIQDESRRVRRDYENSKKELKFNLWLFSISFVLTTITYLCHIL